MSGPYWTDGTVTLYLGDCREVTEWLAADVLVTDPPYGRKSQPKRDIRAARVYKPRFIKGDEDTGSRDEALAAWGQRLGIIFGDLMLIPAPRTKKVLIYRKPPDSGSHGSINGFRHDVEAVYLTGPWPAGLGGTSSVIVSQNRGQGHLVTRS